MFGDITGVYDADGNKLISYTYDAWGNCQTTLHTQNLSGSDYYAQKNPFRYRGYYYDTELGLYYLNARYYDPNTGRFISADSISYLGADGELTSYNLYAYCGNNPIMYTDPTGHMPEWLAWVFSGVAVAIGIALCATGVLSTIGGALIGAGAGGLINGYSVQNSGGKFWAGYVGGVFSGILCGIGAGLGGSAFFAATKATNLACLGYLATSATVSFAGGFAGNLLGTVYTSWHNSNFSSVSIDWRETMQTSIVTGALNVLAGFVSGISSTVAKVGKSPVVANTKLAAEIVAGAFAAGGEILYDISAFVYNQLRPKVS